MATYHRVETGGGTQTQQLAQTQQRTMKVCGYPAVGVSNIPSVKALFGKLPTGRDGIEFETNVAPYSVNPMQGGLVTWPKGLPGVVDEPNGMVCIPITRIALRY